MNQNVSFSFHPSFAVPPLQPQVHVVSSNGTLIAADTAFAMAAGDAEKENPHAMMALAGFYERGIGVPKNFVKALEWYEKAAKSGLAGAFYSSGICYEIGMGNVGDMDKAMSFFEKAAEKGFGPALLKLASLYIAGNRIPQDKEKGLFWLNRAVEAGLPDALNTAGVIQMQGLLDQEVNEQNALEYFKKAAESGSLAAIRNISIVCLRGIDGERSPAKALKWYIIAAKSGYYMEDIKAFMEDLKANLEPEQVQAAEEQADQWLKRLRENRQTGR